MAVSKGNPPDNWPERFLSEYAKTGNISHSARVARVDRKTVHNRKEANNEFAEAMEEAKEQANGALEMEALRRATKGSLKPVFHQGEKCGAIREFSDTLLIFLMKGSMPEKYRERSTIEHTGPGGAPLINEVIVRKHTHDTGDDSQGQDG